jgi:predicted transcriptional regulator YdeE
MKKLAIMLLLGFSLALIIGYIYYNKSKNNMKETITTLPKMKLAGVKFECTNKTLMETQFAPLQQAIGTLMSLGIKAKSQNLYNMAINMTDDYKKDPITGKYDCFIAFEVESFDNLPSESHTFDFVGGKYKIFETEKGPLQKVVFEKWFSIWNNQELKQERAYLADFNVYRGDENFENDSIKIYIGIK